ncbi:MAG: ABC transporter ATP-binding protein [Pseudomonadota bacterium]|uniref:ABC transporter ATP-binding protein n=1 Tax=Thermithiobacillus tepidarius TaxID=929 RepID=UPI00040E5ECC|nr:ABC transporter ATP-binding protein [Thermithiobacillus tepidarius]
MTPAIEVQALRKSYHGFQALAGVDLRIEPGEFFGLLGPNGAGKSTLINVLAGLVRRDSGAARVLGFDVEQDYRLTRRALGVVPQEIVYDPFFSVREILRLQSGYFGLGRNDDWIDELLAELDLSDKANTNMRALSGGMKRRVLIAQALVHRPQVVILDEPTAGVDVELRQSLWRFVRRLNGQGHTIVLTTHYLEEAEALCDRIGILRKGQLIACDSKAALLARNPLKTLTVVFAQPVVVVPELLKPLVRSHTGEALTLQYDSRTWRVSEILLALQALDVDILDLKVQEPDLEDVFVSLLGERE